MSNIYKIQQKLPEYDIDAMLVTNPTSRLYATGFKSSAGHLLVSKDNAWFIIDSRYSEAAQAAISDAEIVPLTTKLRFEEQTAIIAGEAGIEKLGFEEKKVTYWAYQILSGKLNALLIPCQELIDNLRQLKDRAELSKMIKAQRLSEKIFNEILPLISQDITEKELAAEFIYKAHKGGADKESFDPIVVSGSNSSMPHGEPQDRKIQKGFLTIDFGVMLDGWCSDTTRTVCFGEPDDEMILVYNTVLKAQQAGIDAVHGGVKGADVDAAARAVIEDAGFGKYFGHAFSHSLGLEVHESLSCSPMSKDILPSGAIISAEPGIYIPGRFGVRIEDTLYVTDDGCENITKLPKKLMVI